jgi:hypothetical protein
MSKMELSRRDLLIAAGAASVGAAFPLGALAQGRASWPKSLTLGTASVGGTYFIYGGVVAAMLTEKTGVNVSTQQTQGPNQNMILVDGGKRRTGHDHHGRGPARLERHRLGQRQAAPQRARDVPDVRHAVPLRRQRAQRHQVGRPTWPASASASARAQAPRAPTFR